MCALLATEPFRRCRDLAGFDTVSIRESLTDSHDTGGYRSSADRAALVHWIEIVNIG
jgi:hypothetical protein